MLGGASRGALEGALGGGLDVVFVRAISKKAKKERKERKKMKVQKKAMV